MDLCGVAMVTRGGTVLTELATMLATNSVRPPAPVPVRPGGPVSALRVAPMPREDRRPRSGAK